MKHMLLCVSIALAASLSAAAPGHAFSIGEMKVQSYLRTPFLADIPLYVKPSERHQEFIVVIGDASDYEAEGLNRPSLVDALRPSIVLGTADVVRITSKAPIEAAAFDLLLLVRTGAVTIVRRYPVALAPDPKTAPIVVEAAPSEAAPAAEKASAAAKTPPAPARQTPAETGSWLTALPDQYGPVLPGDMLYRVLEGLRVPARYRWQVAVRIWEHNQERFVRGNLHGLPVGIFLDMPPNLGDSLKALSQSEAQQMVAEQWEIWRNRGEMVAATPAPEPAAASPVTDPAPVPDPAEPAPEPAEALAFAPEMGAASPVNHATLESVLAKFERRLEQRLMLPKPAAKPAPQAAVTFVSADDLHSAIQGLEARLIQRLETARRPAGAWRDDNASPQPAMGVGMGTALASFLSADSLVYVFMAQNLILLAIAVGIGWRWYRKRT